VRRRQRKDERCGAKREHRTHEREERGCEGGRAAGGEGREGMGGVGGHEGITFRVSGVEQLLASMDNPQAIPK
jgi:hypothetical protein